MSIQFSNNAATKLVADLAVDALTAEIALEDVAKFPVLTKPEDYFVATITSSVPSGKIEVVKVTSLDTATGIVTMVRAHEGIGANAPVAFEFAIGDRFEHRWTAGSIYEVIKMGEAGGDVDMSDMFKLSENNVVTGITTFDESVTVDSILSRKGVTLESGEFIGNLIGDVTGNTEGVHTGNVVGNADTATLAATATLATNATAADTALSADVALAANKLTTPRSITLTGGATGTGTFDGSGDLAIATTVEAGSGVEVGTIVVWPGGALPEGYLLCNGGTVKKADYPALYAVIGDKYNGGGGSSI